MSKSDSEASGGRLGFLDSLGRLFRAERPATAPAAPQPASAFEKLGADFDAAIRGLHERVEQQQRSSTQAASAGASAGESAEDRAAAHRRRMEESLRAMREDIEKMHGRLRTGLSDEDLDAISAFLLELNEIAITGRNSHDLLPRARYAIAERLRLEAGELAVARLLELLAREKIDWPDPTHYRPTLTSEEVERSRRRRLTDVRESFLALDFKKLAERLQGIVRGWGGDYPDRGSPMWEETVLEGVAAAIRGRLIQEFVEALRRDRDQLLSRTESAVGKEVAALQAALGGGVNSIERANQAVVGALRVLDEVVPEIAWEMVRPA